MFGESMRNIIISTLYKTASDALVKFVSVDAGFRYGDIANDTYTEIAKKLETVDSVILKRPDAAIYIHTTTWDVNLKRIDVEFLKRISKMYPEIDSLIHHFHEISFADISLPRSKYNRSDTIEHILIQLETNADKLVITKKQLLSLKSIYMVACSDKTVIHRNIIHGIRKQLCAVQHLISICAQNGIRVGVLDGDGVTQIQSWNELEACASTFCMDRMVDIYPSNRIIGNTMFISKLDTSRIHKHINRLLRTGCHDSTKFVFMKTVAAFHGVAAGSRNKHNLNPRNTTYYGAADDARHHATVVLLGVPRINPASGFISDPDPAMSVKRYRRYLLLRAIGRARVVYCVGISTKYLHDILSGIPGIDYHGEHSNDPAKNQVV